MGQDTADRVPLKRAIIAHAVSPDTYAVTLPLDHCYGHTAHGGLVVSTILSALKMHFSTALKSQNQPHTFNFQLSFLRPATDGQALVEIKAAKLGTKISTVHVKFSQGRADNVVGYASQMNMSLEEGVSFPTSYKLDPPPPPPTDLDRLTNQTPGPHWLSWTYPWSPHSYLKAATHFRWFSPTDSIADPSIMDLWLTPLASSDEDRFTNEMLGSIADHWAESLENYRPNDSTFTSSNLAKVTRVGDTDLGTDIQAPPWKYLTQSMSMEMKKVLPPEGVKRLFLRARVKRIERGRLDAEVVIADERLELVAVSQQVTLIIPGLGFTKKINKLPTYIACAETAKRARKELSVGPRLITHLLIQGPNKKTRYSLSSYLFKHRIGPLKPQHLAYPVK
ncbi:MAG: hypothetical protein Q9188_005224 [Gyalolechia gomerana]